MVVDERKRKSDPWSKNPIRILMWREILWTYAKQTDQRRHAGVSNLIYHQVCEKTHTHTQKERQTHTQSKSGIDKRNINQIVMHTHFEKCESAALLNIRFLLIEFNANTVIIYELFELSPNRMPIGNHSKCRIFSNNYSFVHSMLFAIISFIHTNKMTHTHIIFRHSDLQSHRLLFA